MKQITIGALSLYAAVALSGATRTGSPGRDVLANRSLLFEPLPGGREYKSWAPNRQFRVSARGWEVVVGSGANVNRRLAMTVVGADAEATAEATGRVNLRSTYIRGNAVRQTDCAFRKVTWKGVLNGLDIAYYGAESNRLEFDLILSAGVNPSAVRLHFSGQDRLSVEDNGDLVLASGETRIVQRFPTIYQESASTLRYVPGRYHMRPDGDVDFVLGRYDRNQPLIIDPVVEYAGYPGGRGDDIATAIVRGTDGFVYIAGTTLSGDLIVTGDAAQGTRGGDADIFVMKIDPNAHGDEAIAYSTFIGGSGRDELHSMARGADGMLYLAGDTASPNFPVSSGAAQSTLKGDLDAFAIKLDPTQTGTAALVYSTYLGGGGKDAALAAAVGSDGSFVLTGYSGSSDFPLAGTPYQSNVAGGWDIFVAQLGPDGALVYSTLLGGESTDMGEAVAIDREGAIIVGGWTSSPYIQLAGSPYQDFHAGRGDGFVFKLVPALGTSGLVYSTYFGGSEHDEVTAVAVDASGRIVVTGSTLSQDFPTTSGALQAQPKGDSDAFVSVFDAARTGTASLIYSTLLGGSDGDVPLAVKLDAQGHAVITGYTFSSDFRVTPDAQQSKNQGLTDAFLTIIDLAPGAASPLLYSTYIGGPIADIAYGLDIDPTGRIYIAGSTSSRTLAPTQADARTTDPGDRNAFLITLRP